jgi:hypothetical protein
MEQIFENRHILDNILKYLNSYDFINTLLALDLVDEYAHRQINKFNTVLQKCDRIDECQCYFECNSCGWKYNLNDKLLLLKRLINHNLKYFKPQVIRDNFDIFWEYVEFDKFNEQFFIDNSDLIDNKKLKQLKKHFIEFNYSSNQDVLSYIIVDNFSHEFKTRFPNYDTVKICYECLNDVDTLGKLCHNCLQNKCPRCYDVVLPKLELNRWGCCEGCAGCSQYDYNSDWW